MAKRRSVTTNYRNRSKTIDVNSLVPWSYLDHDVLLLIMMQLGVIDDLAFSGVCKSWRTLALSYRNKFLEYKHPMFLISTHAKRVWHLKDLEGRNSNIILPKSYGRDCVGLTCGYMIMFGRKTYDFWLVNPITRHQLYFPAFPFHVHTNPNTMRAILVFSSSISGWVFVISFKFSNILGLCLAGKQPSWNHLDYRSSNHSILDIHYFKGKIYIIDSGNNVSEFKLNPSPTLKPLHMNNFSKLDFSYKEFVSSSENLFVMGNDREGKGDDIQELDLEEMIWQRSGKKVKKYAFFHGDAKCSAAKLQKLVRAQACFERIKICEDRFTAPMWYFPHDCPDVNLLQE